MESTDAMGHGGDGGDGGDREDGGVGGGGRRGRGRSSGGYSMDGEAEEYDDLGNGAGGGEGGRSRGGAPVMSLAFEDWNQLHPFFADPYQRGYVSHFDPITLNLSV